MQTNKKDILKKGETVFIPAPTRDLLIPREDVDPNDPLDFVSPRTRLSS